MTRTVALAQARQDLSGIVDEVATTHERIILTRHGEPAAVVISVHDLEALEETLEILADHELVQDITTSLGSAERHTLDEVKARLANRRPA